MRLASSTVSLTSRAEACETPRRAIVAASAREDNFFIKNNLVVTDIKYCLVRKETIDQDAIGRWIGAS